MEHGELSVTQTGVPLKLKLCAGNWGYLLKVSYEHNTLSYKKVIAKYTTLLLQLQFLNAVPITVKALG